jgi:alpha-ketoglutarate-dependent taurine dioxygenase
VLGSSHKKTIFLTGNNIWHSDTSFKPVPAFLSIMCAYETPAEGGETMFVSLRAAYDRLSSERKAEIHPLVAIHDYVYSRSKVAPDAVSPEIAASLPPLRQRLVRTNPATGAKSLFLGSHIREIEGMGQAAGRALIGELTEAAIQPETHLRPRLATRRRRALGQPLPPPRRKRLRRRPPPPLHAPDPRQRNMLDVGGGWLRVTCPARCPRSDSY